MKLSSGLALKAVVLFLLGFITGILFQKYYTVDMLLRDIGLRTQVADQLTGREAVVPSLAESSRTMVAVAFGQSNSANYGSSQHEATGRTYNFFEGRFYRARDPMIGADGLGGSVWTWLGDRLTSEAGYGAVVFATLGVGSSEVARWAPGGDLHDRLLRAVDELSASGLTITHLLWHQGETDARLGTAPEDYRRSFLSMLESLRRRGVTADIYVSVATRCYGSSGVETLRRAQRQLTDPEAGILPGPDTDSLGSEYRYDDCHFSAAGLRAAADLWYDALVKHEI